VRGRVPPLHFLLRQTKVTGHMSKTKDRQKIAVTGAAGAGAKTQTVATAGERGTSPYKAVALVLQGGGALGSYQGGVYEELAKAGYDPTWYAGISIGAINAAILAGNEPEKRLARLREFWDLITSSIDWPVWFGGGDLVRQTINQFSAATAISQGLPGFFRPRFPTPLMHLPGTGGATSYYDTEPLRETLLRLVDFDRINSGKVRLSLGAVNVQRGNYVFFDSTQRIIGPEHVMASAALPPSFPAIEVDGEYYWDGGIVSNTPLFHVLEQCVNEDTLVFEVDLFSAAGLLPTDILEVEERRKDITFSSRTRENTTAYMQKHELKRAISKLFEALTPAQQQAPEMQKLRALGDHRLISLVHLIYRSKHIETSEKDYEFSRRSMEEHWESGRVDARNTLSRPLWNAAADDGVSLRVFDMLRPERPAAE
jgi:NTE family protein